MIEIDWLIDILMFDTTKCDVSPLNVIQTIHLDASVGSTEYFCI